ncbi:MAG: sugar ABC transporter permease [Planctomycetes bacterium]|nr:sugar ABC transporter permease [Planctomycetota bacterium]NOG54855.1 sugar ABC transporter permease [Planctomycetota bacterium]
MPWLTNTLNRNTLSPWGFIAFPLAIVMLFTALPTLAGLLLSLFEWSGGGSPRFIGLKNYTDLIASSAFWPALCNTLLFAAFTVPLTVFFAFLIAAALNAPWFIGRTTMRTIFFLPTVVSIVAIGFIWSWVLDSTDAGLLNHVLTDIVGLPRAWLPEWLGNNPWGLASVIMVSIWRGLGFSIVLYLAAVSNVPRALYDAAAVDGANSWQTLWNVTWPGVRPMTVFLLITGLIGALQVFDVVLVMIGEGGQRWTDVLNLYLYREFTNNRLGFAAAIGSVVLLLTVIMTVAQLKWLNRPEGRTRTAATAEKGSAAP